MNLKNSFPEVESFFNQKKFTDFQLLNFLEEIDRKYKDFKLRGAVSALIKLQLLKFDLQNIPSVSVSDQPSFSKKVQEVSLHQTLGELKSLPIELTALRLKWSVGKLQVLLKQKGINLSMSEILNDKNFAVVANMFSDRLYALDRLNKKRNPVKIITNTKKPKSLNRSINVYSKIEAIGLGKVIYIKKQ